jgi:hypothetical protein
MLETINTGAPNNATSITIGFDIAPYSRDTGNLAGTIDWGGAPSSAYTGNL